MPDPRTSRGCAGWAELWSCALEPDGDDRHCLNVRPLGGAGSRVRVLVDTRPKVGLSGSATFFYSHEGARTAAGEPEEEELGAVELTAELGQAAAERRLYPFIGLQEAGDCWELGAVERRYDIEGDWVDMMSMKELRVELTLRNADAELPDAASLHSGLRGLHGAKLAEAELDLLRARLRKAVLQEEAAAAAGGQSVESIREEEKLRRQRAAAKKGMVLIGGVEVSTTN